MMSCGNRDRPRNTTSPHATVFHLMLRGANIEGVDFYLVDLRDALYDDAQAV
jgi:hypothetical protein